MAIDPYTALMIAQGVYAGYRYLSPSREERQARAYGRTASALERRLTELTMQRLSGRLGQADAAIVEAAQEQQRAATRAAGSQLTREGIRRGLAGSGVLAAAEARLKREGGIAASTAGARARADLVRDAQAQANDLARHYRELQAKSDAVDAAKQESFLNLVRTGAQLYGSYEANRGIPAETVARNTEYFRGQQGMFERLGETRRSMVWKALGEVGTDEDFDAWRAGTLDEVDLLGRYGEAQARAKYGNPSQPRSSGYTDNYSWYGYNPAWLNQ